MKVLSIEAHLSVYLALKYGRMSMEVYMNTRRKSSRISFRRESFHGTFTSVGLILDFGVAAVTALQAVELALVDDAAAVQQVAHQQP